MTFPNRLIFIFCTALGIVLGGSLIGSLSTIITGEQPYFTMRKLAEDMKLWAVVAAIGGSFSSFEALGSGLFSGEFRILGKHFFYVISSFAGAEIGIYLIYTLTGGRS
ncbi:MAG: YtrH family sporulation protein [Peptococcaceae bacterium]